MSEAEAEDFIERLGIMVEDSNENEIKSINYCLKLMFQKRNENDKQKKKV